MALGTTFKKECQEPLLRSQVFGLAWVVVAISGKIENKIRVQEIKSIYNEYRNFTLTVHLNVNLHFTKQWNTLILIALLFVRPKWHPVAQMRKTNVRQQFA